MRSLLPAQPIRRTGNYREVLLTKAFRIVPGLDYNRVSFELRREKEGTRFQLYEVVLQESTTWEEVRDKVYPSLVRYLRYKSIDPGVGTEVVISLFFKDRFHLIEYPEMIRLYCEMEGTDRTGFRARIVQWLSNATRDYS